MTDPRSRLGAVVASAAGVALARVAGAQNSGPLDGASPDPLADLPSFGESFAKMVLWLAVVVALLLVAAKVLPRWVRRAPGGPGASGDIEVVGSVALEPRRRIYLVRIAGKRVLIGSSESGLCRLAGDGPLDPSPTPAGSPNAAASTPSTGPVTPPFDAAPHAR